MSPRRAELLAIAVSLVMGAWVTVATLAIVDLVGGGPPASVVVALVLGPAAGALVYALLHDGPRALPLLLRVRSRRGRR